MKRVTRQIRLDEDIAAMADRLARLQDPPQSTPTFLAEFMRPILRRELAKALERVQKELKGEAKP